MNRPFKYVAASLLGIVAAVAAAAPAQAFPEAGKTLTLIIPFAAGGTTDVGGRLLGAALEEQLGVTVEVVNKAGATTQVGNTALSQSAPDGYSLILSSLPSLSMTYLDEERGAPYKRESFTPIAHFMAGANLLAIPNDRPYQTTADFIAAAVAAPRTVRVGTVGLMSNGHLPGVALELATGAKFAYVHFDGAAPLMTALLAGDVDVAINGVQTTVQHVDAGTVRVLGYFGQNRTKYFPELETLIEQGINVTAPSSFAVLGPAGMADDVVTKLTETIASIMEDASFQQKAAEIGLELEYMNPADLDAFWAKFDEQQKVLIDLARAEN